MVAIKRLLVCASLALAGCAATVINPGDWLHPGSPEMSMASIRRLAREHYLAARVRFPAADGSQAGGILLSRPGASAVVLYIGGGKFTPARDAAPVARDFESMGLDVLILEYPPVAEGHADSGMDAVRMAALGAYDYLDNRSSLARLPVLVHGFDLGSFVAAYVARQRAVAGLVLESAPTNFRDWAHADASWYGRAFSPARLKKGAHDENNIVAVNSYAGPLLLLAGGEDEVTPSLFAKALYRFSLSPEREKTLVIAAAARHGQVMKAPRVRADYMQFVRRIPGAS